MRSQNAKELLKLGENPLFLSLFASISCLVTVAETDDNDEVLELLEMVDGLPVAKKYLLLIISTFDSTKFANITINFQVMMHHKKTG